MPSSSSNQSVEETPTTNIEESTTTLPTEEVIQSSDQNRSPQQQTNTEPQQQQQHQQQSKSIYSKHPELFRYEADQFDRQWLNEHSIIKRKNLKCYLIALDDILDVFKSSLRLATDLDVYERVNQVFISSSTTNDSSSSASRNNGRDLLVKKLKPFSLPDFILYKLNRQYFKSSIHHS
jgi:predicted AAA+ superfamily ATPase